MSSTAPLEFALVDCNNFYVSCERVFNPALVGKPVVVLSNNDGCAIARSKEAKELGIPMGAPAFQYQDIFQKHKIICCSSNYTLYGDMSRRVMQTLRLFSPDVQIYSIDEAFMLVEGGVLCRQARKTVLQHTGIPVSIGIAPTKTLAKIANHLAKKDPALEGVFHLSDPAQQEAVLRTFPVKEIWGIGRQLTLFLNQHGIETAWQLRNADDVWVKKHLTVVGLRTVWELRGDSCLALEEASPSKKSIISSRSFGKAVTDWRDLEEAIASYTARAAEKMRTQESLASAIGVMIESKGDSDGVYSNHRFLTLPCPTDYTPDLITHAKMLLKPIFRAGMRYRKVAVFLEGLVPTNAFQPDLFFKGPSAKQKVLMQFIDQTNRNFGRKVLSLAAEGTRQPWKMKRSLLSPRFTTRWDELLTIALNS